MYFNFNDNVNDNNNIYDNDHYNVFCIDNGYDNHEKGYNNVYGNYIYN